MIGDLAYKLSRYLLVDFKNIGPMTVRQKNFNYKLSQCRVVIENVFGYLKGRFRRLKYLETIRTDLIALLIVAGCIMHNLCILKGDLPEELIAHLELQQIFNENAGDEENPADNLDIAAINKIKYIMNVLDIDRNVSHSMFFLIKYILRLFFALIILMFLLLEKSTGWIHCYQSLGPFYSY